MLKKISGLFLGLVVLAGSACVTPTHASSAFQATEVVLAVIQPAGVSGAKEESIVIHNNGATEVDITSWALTNKANIAFIRFISPTGQNVRYMLPPYSSVAAVSSEYAAAHPLANGDYPFIYTVTNQSSGSIVGGADTITLLNAYGDIIDSKEWTASIANTQVRSRLQVSTTNIQYAHTGSSADWIIEAAKELPKNGIVTYEVIESEEPSNDPGENTPGSSDPTKEPGSDTNSSHDVPILINELLPNPSGTDTGKEFIELYNDSDRVVSLGGYALRFGKTSYKWYTPPLGLTIQPYGYVVFSDTEMGISLTNSSSVVQLVYNQQPVGEPVEYLDAKDDQSWSLIEGVWQYTKLSTPGAKNQLPAIDVLTKEAEVPSQKPCAPNQYRSEDTGRCRLLATASSSPAPCKEGQVRNPETNRCRSLATSSSTLVACKQGQERSSETNRCRAVTQMSKASYGVKGVQTEDAPIQWYIWVSGIGVVCLVVMYIVWEWRAELRELYVKLVRKFARRLD